MGLQEEVSAPGKGSPLFLRKSIIPNSCTVFSASKLESQPEHMEGGLSIFDAENLIAASTFSSSWGSLSFEVEDPGSISKAIRAESYGLGSDDGDPPWSEDEACDDGTI